MRQLLVPAALALVLLIALQPAAGQVPGTADTVVRVSIMPTDEPLRDGMTLHIPILVEYTYRFDGVAFQPTEIRLDVVEAPAWVVATLSPSTVYAPLHHGPSGGTTNTVAQETVLVVDANGTLADAIGQIEVRAMALPNGNLRPSASEESTVVRAFGSGPAEPCVAPKAAADEGDEELATATLGAATPASPLALAGAAAAGAVGGLGVAAFRRRP